MLGDLEPAAVLGKLESPDDPFDIVGVDRFGSLRIDLLQPPVEGLWTIPARSFLHGGAVIAVRLHLCKIDAV